MALTTVNDVTDGFEGVVDDSQTAWLNDLLVEAELVLEARLGDLTVWANTGLRQRLVRRVVVRMVRRVMRNPVGARSDAETIGPISHSQTFDPRVSSGSIWATSDDWNLLGVGASRVGTIKLGSAYRRRDCE